MINHEGSSVGEETKDAEVTTNQDEDDSFNEHKL